CPRPFVIGSDACVRSSACTEDFSSAHNTIAFSGGFRYRPTTSTSFSSNFGSPDTLNVSTRCGLRANSFHTRCTVLFETPATPAIVLVLQCVSPCGRYSSVSVTILSSVASGIEGLRPRPSRTCPNLTRPSSANRVRQFATVAGDTDTAAAIVAFAAPSAAISKALARTTSRCAADCDRANDSNTSRCPSVIANAGTGLLILKSYQFTTNYLGDTPLAGVLDEERHPRLEVVGVVAVADPLAGIVRIEVDLDRLL